MIGARPGLGSLIPEPWASKLRAQMAEVFLTKSSSEWEGLFGAIGVPAAAQQTTDEWLHSEHTRDAGLAVVLKDPKWGSMLQMGPVAWFDHGNTIPTHTTHTYTYTHTNIY
jgi:crotonobetainyl-CoA:carnitine CoA-transferase CaiB-like acyl-CoA transferase